MKLLSYSYSYNGIRWEYRWDEKEIKYMKIKGLIEWNWNWKLDCDNLELDNLK